MKAKKLAKKLNVSKRDIEYQCIKCDQCGEIATVSVASEFSSQVNFYCKSCQKLTTLGGGDLITDYTYRISKLLNGRPLIEWEEVLN